jgi:hypothetical protein
MCVQYISSASISGLIILKLMQLSKPLCTFTHSLTSSTTVCACHSMHSNVHTAKRVNAVYDAFYRVTLNLHCAHDSLSLSKLCVEALQDINLTRARPSTVPASGCTAVQSHTHKSLSASTTRTRCHRPVLQQYYCKQTTCTKAVTTTATAAASTAAGAAASGTSKCCNVQCHIAVCTSTDACSCNSCCCYC